MVVCNIIPEIVELLAHSILTHQVVAILVAMIIPFAFVKKKVLSMVTPNFLTITKIYLPRLMYFRKLLHKVFSVFGFNFCFGWYNC